MTSWNWRMCKISCKKLIQSIIVELIVVSLKASWYIYKNSLNKVYYFQSLSADIHVMVFKLSKNNHKLVFTFIKNYSIIALQ